MAALSAASSRKGPEKESVTLTSESSSLSSSYATSNTSESDFGKALKGRSEIWNRQTVRRTSEDNSCSVNRLQAQGEQPRSERIQSKKFREHKETSAESPRYNSKEKDLNSQKQEPKKATDSHAGHGAHRQADSDQLEQDGEEEGEGYKPGQTTFIGHKRAQEPEEADLPRGCTFNSPSSEHLS